MKKIYREHLEILITELRKLEQEHPKADVFYDIERGGIQVLYPLPKDFKVIPIDKKKGDWFWEEEVNPTKL